MGNRHGDIAAPAPDCLALEEDVPVAITGPDFPPEIPRWTSVGHHEDQRRALLLLAGEELVFRAGVSIGLDSRLYVRYAAGLPSISEDGLVCEIFSGAQSLLLLPISGGVQGGEWRVAEIDLGWMAGRELRLGVRCLPGPRGDPTADWLAIAQLCVARRDHVSLALARTFSSLRARNEIAHFSSLYSGDSSAQARALVVKVVPGEAQDGGRVVRRAPMRRAQPRRIDEPGDLLAVEHVPGEETHVHGSRLLGKCIAHQPPDFARRLAAKSVHKPLRVLSLCSGAARVESRFAARAGRRVEWTLLDINRGLLEVAARQFAPDIQVDLIEANANELRDLGEQWDVILCVSALHHVVELERLVEFCHSSLRAGGELWSIGENIGRNGNRLWPDGRDAVDAFFRQLPERLRRNRHTGAFDAVIPDKDYSVACFEGIRSEEIEAVLDARFQQKQVYRRNCFLWRIVDPVYGGNYDLDSAEDRGWLVRAVHAEYAHHQAGGRPTELFGIYRPRAM